VRELPGAANPPQEQRLIVYFFGYPPDFLSAHQHRALLLIDNKKTLAVAAQQDVTLAWLSLALLTAVSFQ